MNALFGNIWRVVVALWGIGNFWLRVAIAIVASWPVLIVLAALFGWSALTATVALLPLVSLVIILMTSFDPAFLAVLGFFGGGRTVLGWIASIIGIELTIGTYFAAVPVANDRTLIPLAILVILAITLLALGVRPGIMRRLITLLAAFLVLLTTVFFLGGREKASERLERAIASASAPAGGLASQTFEVGPRDWVKKPIPADAIWNTGTDAPVWIWANGCGTGGCMYMLLPDGSILKGDSVGDMKPAPPCRPGGPPCMDFGTAVELAFKARDKNTLAKVTLGVPARR